MGRTPKKSTNKIKADERSESASRVTRSNKDGESKQTQKSTKNKERKRKSIATEDVGLEMVPIKSSRKSNSKAVKEKITKAIINDDEDAVDMEVREEVVKSTFPMSEDEENKEEIDESSDEESEVIITQRNNNATINQEVERCEESKEDEDDREQLKDPKEKLTPAPAPAVQISQEGLDDALVKCLSSPSDKLLKAMEMNGFVRKEEEAPKEKSSKGKKSKDKSPKEKAAKEAGEGSISETTIYKGAVRMQLHEEDNDKLDMHRRGSSSSEEEAIDTSDEVIDECNDDNADDFDNVSDKIAEIRKKTKYVDDGQVAHSSKDYRYDDDDQRAGERRADDLIRRAEASKAKMYNSEIVEKFTHMGMGVELIHSVLVDEQYSMVAAHVDSSTKSRIIAGKYVDFVRLLPRDRQAEDVAADDQVQQLVIKGGRPVWMTNAERSMERSIEKEGLSISGFGKWEQAFRVFSNIYTEAYPNRSQQLTQYSHVIHSAAMTFVWSNVYAYDKDFRIHLSQFPDRSWGIILQQAWNMRLREKLTVPTALDRNSQGGDRRKRESCWRFNQGNCTYGQNCRFEHKCAFCGKFGHGSARCRKAKYGNDNGRRENNNNHSDRETGERRHDYQDKSKKNFQRRY